MPRKHIVIPDSQITPSAPIDHLRWIGEYIVEKRPDVVVHLGDFNDMESLSPYDKGKRQFEGRRYVHDIQAGRIGMEAMNTPLVNLQKRQIKNKERVYRPEKHMLLGNHERRIITVIDCDPKAEGLMSIDDLGYKDFGFTVHDFLKPVCIDGVSYCHYFYNPLSGKPYGGQSIDTRLKNIGFSFVQGHQQTYMVGTRSLNNGKRIRGLICGASYLHDEDYRGYQANNEWRGIFVLHEVEDGDYGLLEVSLDFLCRKYEGVPLHEFMRARYPEIYQTSMWMQQRAK